jgi:hypothetical protein
MTSDNDQRAVDYQAYEAPEPPADLAERVLLARAERHAAAQADLDGLPGLPPIESAPRRTRRVALAVGALAAVAAALLLALYLLRGDPPRPHEQLPVVKKTPGPAVKPPVKRVASLGKDASADLSAATVAKEKAEEKAEERAKEKGEPRTKKPRRAIAAKVKHRRHRSKVRAKHGKHGKRTAGRKAIRIELMDAFE